MAAMMQVDVTETGGLRISQSFGPVLASMIVDPGEELDFLLDRLAKLRDGALAVKAARTLAAAEAENQSLGVVKVS